GDQAQVMYAHLESAPNLSHLPRAEGAVLARALAKEPGKRWKDCKAFANELIKAHQEVARQQAEQRKQDEEHQRLEIKRRRDERDSHKPQGEPAQQQPGERISAPRSKFSLTKAVVICLAVTLIPVV